MSAIITAVCSIIDKIIPDQTQANEAKLQAMKLAQSGELDLLKQQMAPFLAEAGSPDKWTSRARPSFLYIMYVLILFCIPMGIAFAISPDKANSVAKGMQMWLAAIPKPLWEVFGLSFSIYSVMRTHEKQPFVGSK